MLGLSDLKQTRVYQEALEEEARSLVLRILTRKLGEIPQDLQGRIEELSLSQLENLSEALLDFGQMDDLVSWLEAPSEEEVLRPAKHPPALWLIQNSALFLPDT
ncbi:MAG: DUF4351 domain-containing protein, partial [Pseudanabaenales cyanobacterium]|nr:DUF4351 domain-containing protein [Pseudanabaenales cyanobacterium]